MGTGCRGSRRCIIRGVLFNLFEGAGQGNNLVGSDCYTSGIGPVRLALFSACQHLPVAVLLLAPIVAHNYPISNSRLTDPAPRTPVDRREQERMKLTIRNQELIPKYESFLQSFIRGRSLFDRLRSVSRGDQPAGRVERMDRKGTGFHIGKSDRSKPVVGM